MFESKNLFDVLRRYTLEQEEHPLVSYYLFFNIRTAEWGFFCGSEAQSVWLIFADPNKVMLLLLDPASAVSAIAVSSPTDFAEVLTRYAVFTASRPSRTGLHHFITVPEPDGIIKDRLEEKAEEVN